MNKKVIGIFIVVIIILAAISRVNNKEVNDKIKRLFQDILG